MSSVDNVSELQRDSAGQSTGGMDTHSPEEPVCLAPMPHWRLGKQRKEMIGGKLSLAGLPPILD